MKYIVDIDGTICTTTNGDYANAEPYLSRIQHFNMLYDANAPYRVSLSVAFAVPIPTLPD